MVAGWKCPFIWTISLKKVKQLGYECYVPDHRLCRSDCPDGRRIGGGYRWGHDIASVKGERKNWGGDQHRKAEKGGEREHNGRWERLASRMDGNPGDGRQNRMFGSWPAYNITQAS